MCFQELIQITHTIWLFLLLGFEYPKNVGPPAGEGPMRCPLYVCLSVHVLYVRM